MLIKKMKCPQGCQDATFMESVKTVADPNAKLLLDSQGAPEPATKTVKVYTCNCCHNTFEVPENNTSDRMVL